LLVLWAVLAPGFRAPDEPQHVNSVMRLATGGGWPDPGQAMLSDATLLATREAGFTGTDQAVSRALAPVLPRSIIPSGGLEFAKLVPVPPHERSVLDHTADLQDEVAPTVDQMTQHPPLYYALAALTVRAFGALDWRWDHQLLLLRLLNCLIATAAVPLVAATARQLTGSRPVALTAAAGLVAIGQFAHINAAVSNDTLATVLGMSTTFLAARALTRQHGPGLAVVSGVVLGLGLLTKGFMLAAIPMVAFALLLTRAATRDSHEGPPSPGRRSARRWANAGIALAVAFVVGGWWWLRNLLRFGTVQPDGMKRAPLAWGDQEPNLAYFLREAVDKLTTSFWGNFAWLELPLPGWLIATMTSLLAVALAAALATGVRHSLLVLGLFPLGTVAVILFGTYRSYVEQNIIAGLQGRYLFSTLAVLLPAAAIGAMWLAGRVAPGVAPRLPAPTLAAALASAAYALLQFFRGAYQPTNESLVNALVRWEAWSPLSRPEIGIVVGVTIGLAAWTLIALARFRPQSPTSLPVLSEPVAGAAPGSAPRRPRR
jgi:uncharacterized membrane protein